MGIINWIHISDLHFGCDEGASTKLFRMEVSDYINRYFGLIGKKPEYLFITGDIIFPKDNNDIVGSYEKAKDFILSIIEQDNIEISKDNIFIVPGNHDVTSDKSKRRYESASIIREKNNYNFSTGKVENEHKELWNDLKPTTEFQKFFFDLRGEPYENNHVLYHHDDINIFCIDTSIVSIGSKNDYEKLFVGSNEVIDILKTVKKDKPIFILAHHPLSFFNKYEGSILKRTFSLSGVVLYLYGHKHFLETDTLVPKLLPIEKQGDLYSSIDAISCPTHMDEVDNNKFSTKIGVVTGTYDTQKRIGEVVFHIWPSGDSSEDIRQLEYPLGKKSKEVIDIHKQMEEEISRIKREYIDTPKPTQEIIFNIIRYYFTLINLAIIKELNIIKDEILLKNENEISENTSNGGVTSVISGETNIEKLSQKEEIFDNSNNEKDFELQLMISKNRNE